jgi:hypothetical protein
MSAALFCSDGLVNDVQREFWGPAAITRWADRECVGGYDITGLPELLVPTFSFSLAGDGISRLIIVGKTPGY